jgi:hypothetical protein
MWLTVIKLLVGKSIVEYFQARLAVNTELKSVGDPVGWLISGDEDTPGRHRKDLPDEEGARRLRGLESSRALRRLGISYRRQPIRAAVADED